MPKTAHLQPELITFLKQLKKNNNREWPTPGHPHPGGPALHTTTPDGPTPGHFVGAARAVQLGDPEVWRRAVAAL